MVLARKASTVYISLCIRTWLHLIEDTNYIVIAEGTFCYK
jgi:hypothetical protein